MPLFKKKVWRTFDKYLGLVIFEGSFTGNSDNDLERKRKQGVACF